MQFRKPSKKTLIAVSVVFLVLVIVVLIVNAYLGEIIENKIRQSLNKNKTVFKVSLSDVKFNIISGNIKVYDLSIQPDSAVLDELEKGHLPMQTLQGAEIPMFKIAGIGYYQALFNEYLEVRKIELNDAHVTIYRGKKPDQRIKEVTEKKRFRPDSIYIKGINGINLKKIVFSDCQFDLYDLEKKEYELQSGKVNILLTGVDLVKREGEENAFRMGFNKFNLELSFDDFKLPGGWYNLAIKKLTFNMPDSSIVIRDLKYWPQYDDLDKMARDQKYTKEIFKVSVGEIKIFQYNARWMVRQGGFFMDSIQVSDLDVNILKDKRYPFNETLRPKLPHQSLKSLKIPLDIKKVILENGDLKYQEKNEGEKDLMTVSLNDIDATIENITSVQENISQGAVLRIHLKTKILGKASADVRFAMPLNSYADTMYFTGYVGSSSMKPFNKATIPALGIEITDGKLNSVDFSGSANDHHSSGEMTMRYEGLEAEVYKKESKEANKFVTWVANAAVHNNNPGRNGKLRVALMEFDRVMYKGFGNFIWKTLQSGIMNSVSPAGKNERTETPAKKEDDSKSKRKRRRSRN